MRAELTMRCGCDGGRNLSGWARVFGLPAVFFALAAGRVEEKQRRAVLMPRCCWSVWRVLAVGRPRGRRKLGIGGEGIVADVLDTFSMEWRGYGL